MQTNSNPELLRKVTFLTGNPDDILNISHTPAKKPFDCDVVDFLNDVSGVLMKNKDVRQYSDIITFAFWIRKASVSRQREYFIQHDGTYKTGRGAAFHIAPSNVPVNFAYSLAAGLLGGNANIVRVPSKEFEQVSVIAEAFNTVLKNHPDLKPYVFLVRYGRDREINDLFSSVADIRVVWGGDATIAELRKSPLPPRSIELTFADRYSIAVIDSDSYLTIENKGKTAEDFYNDTFLSDQNACTSPRIVVWTGEHIEEAKNIFWNEEHKVVERKYNFKAIQAVNKLTGTYLAAIAVPGCKVETHRDNRIVRINVPEVNALLMDYKGNSGFFFEYDCKDIIELKDLCDDKRCQTIAYIGENAKLLPLLQSGVKGIDRIVPIGKTMDFDLIWDGYNFIGMMSRTVSFR